MRHRLFLPLIVSCTLLFAGLILPHALSTAPAQDNAHQHRFRIAKLNGLWKVHDPKDTRTRIIRASAGDDVIWNAGGSDLYFQFPDTTLFGANEATVADGDDLTLTVSAGAKPGRYTYSVFCSKENKFATGDSPPIIIIK
jgi:hypothetical protein